jgi:S1-C subfamily serine protease
MIPNRIPAVCFLLLLFSVQLSAKAPVSPENPANATGLDLGASVVRIEVADQEPDYHNPWNAGHIGGGVGSGFVIERPDKSKRILTNAHVVSNARFITLTREGLSRPYTARVEFIAHDCDLAQLTVDDPSFFDGTRPLETGGIPDIESAVSVYGYPLGGERLGVTRGVVSRIDFDTYTHSAVDSHLVIQIDAAINPGNSGGPVLQNGKLVGVAFQGYSGDVAQNVGFMIPSPVINRFLKDISKGSYTGYTDLSMAYRPVENDASRRALGLTDPDHGVLVTDVHEKGSSFGHLIKGDILLSIDGHPIASNGRVEIDGQSVDLSEIVERKFSGDSVSFSILRDGKSAEVSFPLQGTWPFHMQSNSYDEKPRYLLHGGLLFQPLDRNFITAVGQGDLRLRHAFEEFVEEHLYLDHPEIVVLSRVLADPLTKDCDGLQPGIVDTINGKKIRSLSDAADAFSVPAKYDVIILQGNALPIVLKRDEELAAEKRILGNYGVTSPANL